MFTIRSMARNEWSRWGRGDCVGYNLSIGDGGYVRFEGSVVRHPSEGNWYSLINGGFRKWHATIEEAMGRVEFELAIAGDSFVASYAGYKANRHKNKFSQAVDTIKKVAPA